MHAVLVLLVGATLLLSAEARATVIASHLGSLDPTTEGWGQILGTAASGNVLVGGILDGSTNAWFVDDNSVVNGSTLFYESPVSASEVAQGSSLGWTLSANLRLLDASSDPFATIDTVYRDGVKTWELEFLNATDGDPVVRLRTSATADVGIAFELQGAAGTYNDYALVFDPGSGTADLFVNGIEQISNYAGVALVDVPRVVFGAGRSPGVGEGRYQSVGFSVVPEPGTALLLGLGLFGIRSRRR